MKTTLRLGLIACLMVAFLGAPASVMAQESEATQNLPGGLQEAILASTLEEFTQSPGKYTTERSGLAYELGGWGLQAQGESLQWNISLRGMGRGNEVRDAQAPEIVQTEERLEYRRGVVTEWYRDTALGLEQGFTISESPQGNGRLVLHLDLSTDLEGRLDENERGISFAGADGQILHYAHLKAYDADGVELDARMIYNPSQVVIQVDDRGAAYPITIDPIIYLEQEVMVVDGEAGDNLGYSVAIDSDVALVGAANDDIGANANQGSAYVFVREENIWSLLTKITAPDGAVNDYFGCSVALSGDTALIGARDADIGTNSNQGAVYVFVRYEDDWIQQAKLTASDGAGGDVFGWSVALEEDIALVGAPWHEVDKNVKQGEVYVYVRGSGTTWSEQARITALDGTSEDDFGKSVALSADTALIGAPRHDVDAYANAGAAYVFTRGDKDWTLQQQLSGWILNQSHGASVALSGDTAMVGPGWVNIYERSGETWTRLDPHLQNFGEHSPGWGFAIALSGDTAIVSSSSPEPASILQRTGSTWSQVNTLSPSDSATSNNTFTGASVALSGDTALVGSLFDNVGANSDQGAAYFYQAYRNADLGVSVVKAGSKTVYPGGTVNITVSVTNYGPKYVTPNNPDGNELNVVLNVDLPVGLTLVAQRATYGTYSPLDGTWSVGDLPYGVTASLYLQTTVDMTSYPSVALIFNAEIPIRDINDANNSATLNLLVKKKERALNGGLNTYLGTSMIPMNWTAAGFSATDGKDTTAANIKEGAASVKISNTTPKIKTLTQTLSTLGGPVGDPFIFSYWVKGNVLPAAGLCQAQVIFYNGATVVGTRTLTCGFTGTFVYKQRTLSFTAPGAYTNVIIKFTYSKANGTVWFDLVSLLR